MEPDSPPVPAPLSAPPPPSPPPAPTAEATDPEVLRTRGPASRFVFPLACVLTLVVFVAPFAWMALGGPALALGVLALPLAAFLGYTCWADRHDARGRSSARNRLCLGCTYPLADLPAQGRCPECGRAYSHDELERAWRATYGR